MLAGIFATLLFYIHTDVGNVYLEHKAEHSYSPDPVTDCLLLT